ncbi:MacA family efflux pump subunit [Acinetobacter puyangensis]|uniref:MacA family efflux pump subunit n=1 Tax=Acinetobacter puyangensis TaxID=1096779 RepID=UPI003A4DA0D5
MQSRSKLIKYIIAAIVIIVLALCAWWFLKPKQQTTDYITAEVSRGDLENTVLATGTLDATKIISVGAQVSGQVEKMYVELGQEVKKGDPIAQIDSTTQQNNLKTAEANIRNLQAQRLQQVASLTQVQQEYQRQKQMFAQDATSRADYESALASYQTAQAQISAIDAQIESAKVTRDTAQTNIGYTHIVAPMDGTIVAIVTEEGQTVNANQSAPTIVKLAELNNMTIKAEISEADVMKVEKGQTVYFTTLGDSDTKHYATLRQIEPAPDSISDESTSSSSSSSTAIYYNALFDVPNPDGKLRIDMTAQVSIILADAKNVLTIPASAIQSSSNRGTNNQTSSNSQTTAKNTGTQQTPPTSANVKQGPARLELSDNEKALIEQGKATRAMVRVVQADGIARPQPVLIGLNNRVTAEVIKGLNEGDKVVIADGSDTSNNSSKTSNRMGAGGPPMRM